MSVLRVLENQEQQARRDLAKLLDLRTRALADPVGYLSSVLANVWGRPPTPLEGTARRLTVGLPMSG